MASATRGALSSADVQTIMDALGSLVKNQTDPSNSPSRTPSGRLCRAPVSLTVVSTAMREPVMIVRMMSRSSLLVMVRR